MKTYEILEHTADLKIRAFGKDLPELFSNILCGMFEAMKPRLKSGIQKSGRPDLSGKIRRPIKISSIDQETLLVDFLSEALYQSQINKEAYFEANIDRLTNKKLVGELIGRKVDGFEEEIKAVTYHGLEIKRVDDHWQAVVLFDI